ncbi:CD1375 family protein [Tepidimicrobium xylanilyticum]
MKWNIIDLKLIDAWSVLVLAERKTIEEVPEKYRQEVKIKVAEKTIEVLGGENNDS